MDSWLPKLRHTYLRKAIRLLLLIGAYALVAIFTTWPLIQNLESHLAGPSTDVFVHYWNNWWVQKALLSGQSPYFTTYLNYPYGVSLIGHNFAWFNILPWLTLEPWLGGIKAYNVVILTTLLLCGLAMYALVLDTIGRRLPAFLAGIIYMSWPFRLSQLDHPNMMSTYWIPILLLFLGRLLRSGRWRHALLTSIAIACVGYTRWQLLIPAFLMALIYLLGMLPTWWPQKRLLLPRLAAAAGLGFLFLLPPLYSLVAEQAVSSVMPHESNDNDEHIMSTDWLAYITPPRRHPQLKAFTNPLYDQYYSDRGRDRRNAAYIGLPVLILVVLGLLRGWRKNWYWLLMALLFMLLASGMEWRINGQYYGAVPTLYRLLAPLRLLRLMRIPDRYVMFTALPLAMLAAYGWQVIVDKRRSKLLALFLTCALSIIILIEYTVYPVRMQEADEKSYAAQLAAADDQLAVLNYPLRFRFSKEAMFDQTIHQKPILQGHVSREPENLYRFIYENEWIGDLKEMSDPGYLMAQLAANGIGYVVVPNECNDDNMALCNWGFHMPTGPKFEDSSHAVYATRPDVTIDRELAPGLGIVSTASTMFCSPYRRLLVVHVTWNTAAVLPADYELRLEATTAAGAYLSEPYPLHENWPSAQWPPGTLTRHAYALEIPPGEPIELLALSLLEGEQKVAAVDLQPPGCDLTLQDTHEANITFGERITLKEYRFAYDDAELLLSPLWFAEKRPITNYKIFVHVLDANSGDVLAQVDTLPKNWTFPTPIWRAGEIVADTLVVPLGDLPPGIYDVALGFYDADTGARLPAVVLSGGSERLPDDRVLLPQQIEHRMRTE
ncbi:MAG: hypothetical protein R3293_09870 [Candidatus Promineifilaceae bacterium]|nr:hypothetical protein [Candidatus Promineifilaceae bacterium]